MSGSRNWMTWAAAATVLGAIAVSAFTLPYGPPRNLRDMINASVVAALTLVLRAAVQRYPSRTLLRRILPFALTASTVTCGWAAFTQSGQAFVVLAALAAAAAAYDFGLPTACAVTGVGVALVEITGIVYQVQEWVLLCVPMFVVLGLLFGRLVLGYQVHAEQSAKLLANAEQLRTEQSRTAALDERNRIAREIHDVLAHSLGSLGVQIQAAKAVLTDQGDVDRAVDLLTRAQRSAAEGLTETRRALKALRSDTPPLPDALDLLGSEHRRQYLTPVTFEVSGRVRTLTPDASLALARAAQESLVNAAKHAPRQPVLVRLDFADGATTLLVRNAMSAGASAAGASAAGASAAAVPPRPRLETANGGYGLAGMRERLRLIGGSLEACATGGSWVVTAQVPQ